LSYNNLDQSGIVCPADHGYIWVTEGLEPGVEESVLALDFDVDDSSMRNFPGFPYSKCRESWDLEEMEHQIERLVATRGVYDRPSQLDLRALVGPAV